MIKGNGIDIIEIGRIKRAINRNGKFLERLFTSVEREYISSRNENVNTIAGLFAGKEAISKSIGSGIREFRWKDIEIDHDNMGKPLVVLKGVANEIAKARGITDIHLSISHTDNHAIAFAIAEEELQIDSSFSLPNEKKSYKIIDRDLVIGILPIRKKEGHKGTYGKVGIIAGSKGMTGAAYLTSMASLRSGSGLVYLVIPESLNGIMETKTTEVITIPIKDDGKGYFEENCINKIKELIGNFDVLGLGPGLGVDKGRIKVIKEILLASNKTVVLDGDGINCIVNNTEELAKRTYTTVITPHPGELSRLLNVSIEDIQNNRLKFAKLASNKFKVITVLKGDNTIVCNPEGAVYINTTGNPGMATAGSGDLLTGIIASFIGQGIEEFNAVVAGVFIHGLAGDLAANHKGQYGLIASDILEYLPYAIKKIIDQ